jgi:hypothetical protein
MKVITASTPEQHQYIKDQIKHLFDSVFPVFFTKEYTASLKQFKILDDSNLHELNLQEIMEVTAAVQAITTILENKIKDDTETSAYESLFNKNMNILNNYKIDCPFSYRDFSLIMPSVEKKG